MIVSDFWLGVILTIVAEAIIILIVDYLGQKEREENKNVKDRED